jgi:hypothetical protein
MIGIQSYAVFQNWSTLKNPFSFEYITNQIQDSGIVTKFDTYDRTEIMKMWFSDGN